MQARIPHTQIPRDQFSDEMPDSQIVEQVAGTRPVPVSTARPRLFDPGQRPVPLSNLRGTQRSRLRRAHTIFGLIIASLFAFYLAWTFVQASRDVSKEQENRSFEAP